MFQKRDLHITQDDKKGVFCLFCFTWFNLIEMISTKRTVSHLVNSEIVSETNLREMKLLHLFEKLGIYK